jgi:hypothetical protein
MTLPAGHVTIFVPLPLALQAVEYGGVPEGLGDRDGDSDRLAPYV